MGIQSRIGKESTSAPPAKGRKAAKVAMLLTVAGDASAAQTAFVAKELLQNAIVGRQDADDPSDKDADDQP